MSSTFDIIGIDEHNEYKDVEYLHGEFPYSYPLRRRFDFVSCNHLIEHTNNPKLFIERLIQLTKRYIYITTPDADTIRGNSNWKYFSYPEHFLFIGQKFIDYIKIKYGLVTIFQQEKNKDLIILLQKS